MNRTGSTFLRRHGGIRRVRERHPGTAGIPNTRSPIHATAGYVAERAEDPACEGPAALAAPEKKWLGARLWGRARAGAQEAWVATLAL